MPTRATTRTVAAAAAALLLLSACGSDDASTAGDAAAVETTTGAEAAAGEPGALPELTGDPTDTSVEAQVEAGGENPPTELLTEDLVVGEGDVATLQDEVLVSYTGLLYSDGSTFDSSWAGGEPIAFPLSGVVPGFAQGIEGMAEGGRRIMAFPSDLGYGPAGQGPIPGGAALVFVVDLVELNPAA